MTNTSLADLKVGDQVEYAASGGIGVNKPPVIAKVEKITKAYGGTIIVKDEMFDLSGLQRGTGWYRSRIAFLTPERREVLIQEAVRRRLLSRLNSVSFEELPDDILQRACALFGV